MFLSFSRLTDIFKSSSVLLAEIPYKLCIYVCRLLNANIQLLFPRWFSSIPQYIIYVAMDQIVVIRHMFFNDTAIKMVEVLK